MSQEWWYNELFHGSIQGVNVVLKSSKGLKVLHDENCFGSVCNTDDSAKPTILYLSFEEAFFLSYALGCLSISYESRQLDLVQIWNHFHNVRSKFPLRYVCYQHFCVKGWVLKDGLTYGADFLLYRTSPKYSHAEYAVITIPAASSQKLNKSMRWNELAGAGRLNHSVAKELILGFVTIPEKEKLPFCLKEAEVEEVLFSKWGCTGEDLDNNADADW